MRTSNEPTNSGFARRRLLLGSALAAALVMLAALPVRAQGEKKEVEKKRSAERLNGKSMYEWMKDLREKDPSIRERAIAALKVYGAEAREASREVIKAINDRDMSLRVNAIITLGFIGMDAKDRQDGINALKGRLSDNQGIVRFQAASALGRLPKGDAYDAVPQLITATRDTSCWEIRAAAVTALGHAGFDPGGDTFDLNAFHALLEAARDSCVEVRLQTVISLINFGTPGRQADYNTLQRILTTLQKDKQKRVAILAGVALMRIQRPDDPKTQKYIDKELGPIGKLLRDPELQTRTMAARAIGFVGEKAKSQVPELIDALSDLEPQMVVLTIQALGNIGPAASNAYNALKRLEQNPDPAIRDAVRVALEKIGAKGK
ncbi:MAG TPA: HEAT repeat domain-containing protein [Gemmataceae bacterium]|jgi:HEAT repeat protein|nr:HEAT repeat domain-containing protein [Gemmataceae bacterium]